MTERVKPNVCESCGARLSKGEEFCDLCGEKVFPRETEPEPASPPAETGAPVSESPHGELRCRACEAVNPPDARFCNQCGERISAPGTVPAPPPPDEVPAHEPEGTGAIRNGIVMAGVAVLAVLVLFGISLLSHQSGTTPPTMIPPAETPVSPLNTALPADVQRQAEALERRIEEAADLIAELDLRQELVSVYREAGRPDLAAEAQRPVAEALESAYAWAFLGDLYYEFMLSRDEDHAQQLASLAISAYQRSLELDPDNLDVRTHLSVAYLYDPVNPMRAIDEINYVLSRDPDHVQANYNRGMMFAQIGRFDEALAQFEKVLALTEEGSVPHDRAIDALRTIQNAQRRQVR